jgi:hypothetical protein
VSVMEEWPSTFETMPRSTPAASISEARPWRRSWSRTGRSPLARTSSPNVLVTWLGESGLPSSRAKTRAWGCKPLPPGPLSLLGRPYKGPGDASLRWGVVGQVLGVSTGEDRPKRLFCPVHDKASRVASPLLR